MASAIVPKPLYILDKPEVSAEAIESFDGIELGILFKAVFTPETVELILPSLVAKVDAIAAVPLYKEPSAETIAVFIDESLLGRVTLPIVPRLVAAEVTLLATVFTASDTT
jgi:hypothetical protein